MNTVLTEDESDPNGRRVRRSVDTFNGTSWSQTKDTHYSYWNWNVIEEHHSQNNETRRYVWGEDLSGSLQGAGGVGGLLASEANGSHHFYHYDGNGNVTELTNDNGTVVASYRYTAFGQLRSSSGSAAEANEYRFSTKPYDPVSKCYYYGYRFYDPGLGRWLNRDPIGESGGVNVYAFVGNNGVNLWDVLGYSSNCRSKSGFKLEFKDFKNVSVTLDDSNSDPPTEMTGVPGDLFDIYFRIRGSAKVKVSCYRTQRESDGCCKTTKASLTVGPFVFDETISQRVSLLNPLTGWRALNLARWASRIAGNVDNIPKIKNFLKSKANADAVCQRILK